MKVLLTGGHLTPALAIIEYVQRTFPDHELVFVGRDIAQITTGQPSIEHTAVQAYGVKFVSLQTGKLHQKNIGSLLQQAGQFLQGFRQAWKIVSDEQPSCILSFGGYIAVPVVLVAWLKGIPSVTHEQTRVKGVANSFLSNFTRFVGVSYPESIHLFPKKKTVLTGNPLRRKLVVSASSPSWYGDKFGRPLLYVTGGSQGARQINKILAELLPELTKKWFVVHQTGIPLAGEKLPETRSKYYHAQPWFNELELGWLYKNVAVVIGRAGANTTMELQAFGIPSILIPLAFTHHSEQDINADALVDLGMAEKIAWEDASAQTVRAALEKVHGQLQKYRLAAESAQKLLPDHPEERLYKLVLDAAQMAQKG